MIKLVCFFRRKPGLSAADFHRHWLDDHGSLIAETPELARHLVRYEQNHRLDWDYERDDPAAPGFDGATIQWLESMDSFGGFVREAKYRQLIAPDEERFIDRPSITLLFTDDDDVKIDGGAAPRASAGLKLCCLLRRKPGIDAAQFHGHWAGRHAALFSQRPQLGRHIVAYHQSHRRKDDYARDGGGGYDGLAEQWYESRDAFRAMIAEPAYAEVPVDEREFIDPAATRFILSGPPDVIIA
jgi:uncharacterized protein (TIGR02118 family)